MKKLHRFVWVWALVIAAVVLGSTSMVFAGTTITVGVGGWAVDGLRQALEELQFTEKTGITVEVVTRPGTPPEFLSQMTSAIMAGSTPYDVVDVEDDVAINMSRAGWLVDLNPLFDAKFWEDWSPEMLEMIEVWYKYKGELFRIPHNYEAQYFFYRKDIFDEKGLTPPNTWEEMVEVAKKLTGDGMYGVSDGLAKGAFLEVYLGYLSKQAGGSHYDFDDALRTALEFLYDMIHVHKVFPASALNKDYDAVNQDYMNDRVAMMRQWPFFYDVARANEDWFEEDKVAIALPPAGPAGRVTYAAAWGWVIPKTTDKLKAAKTFVEFMSSTENAPKLAKMSTWYLNTRKSVMEAVGNSGLAKHLREYSEAGVIGTRPFHEGGLEANAIIEDLASAYLTNQITIDEVLSRGKARMKELQQ